MGLWTTGLWVVDVILTTLLLWEGYRVYKERFKLWHHLEEVLASKMAAAMAKELDMDVMLRSLTLNRTRVVLQGLALGEETVDAPFSAYFGEIIFETSDFVSLLTLGGLAKFGGDALPFVCGFSDHEIDRIVLRDVVATLYSDEDTKEDPRQLKKKKDVVQKMFKTKKYMAERTAIKKEKKRERRKTLADEFQSKWHPENDEYIDDFVTGSNLDADWEVGSFSIVSLDVDLYGHLLHVDECAVHGFVGSTAQLQREVSIQVMNEIVGPRSYLRHLNASIQENARAARRDCSDLRASIRHDFRPSVAWQNLRTFLWKHPKAKTHYARRQVYAPVVDHTASRRRHSAVPRTPTS